MILAGGLGTRLRPLTNETCKAMVELNGKPLLEHAILYLKKYGFDEIIVNVHHFAEHIIDFLKAKENFGLRIEISDERGQLLETGGGLKKAAWFLKRSDPFLLYNVDVYTDLNLDKLIAQHLQKKAMVTLACRLRYSSRNLLFSVNDELQGWRNNKTGEVKPNAEILPYSIPLAFSGISVMRPTIFNHMHQKGKFSIVETWLELAANHRIFAHQHDESIWMDLGTKERLSKVEEMLQNR